MAAKTVSDLEVFQSAKVLIDQRGGHEALQHAGSRALAMHASGDLEGEATWCRIIDAIQELRRTTPLPGEHQH